jgi:hypothetical protein
VNFFGEAAESERNDPAGPALFNVSLGAILVYKGWFHEVSQNYHEIVIKRAGVVCRCHTIIHKYIPDKEKLLLLFNETQVYYNLN